MRVRCISVRGFSNTMKCWNEGWDCLYSFREQGSRMVSGL